MEAPGDHFFFNLSAFSKCFAQDISVVLNPNKSNLTVAAPRTRGRKTSAAERRRDRSRDRYGDRNRRREWGERADERRRGSEVGKENNKASQCQVLGIRRRHPKAVRVIREEWKTWQMTVCPVLNAHWRPIAATRLFAVAYCRDVEEGTRLTSSRTFFLFIYRGTSAAGLPARRPVYCENSIRHGSLGMFWRPLLTSDCPFDFCGPSSTSLCPFFSAPVTGSPSHSSPRAFYFRTADDNRAQLRRFIHCICKNTNRSAWPQPSTTSF